MNDTEKAGTGLERWWEQAYSDMIYWKFNGETPAWAISSMVGFIEKTLGLTPGAKVLDVGCGLGAHSIELARRGYLVTGLDSSVPFVEEATRRAVAAGVHVDFVPEDATRMTFDGIFDAAILMGNTFGMWSDQENSSVLLRMRQALRPSGMALIDTANHKGLPEKLEKSWEFHQDDKDLLMLTEGTRDVRQGRFGFNVVMIELTTGRRHVLPFSWRLYLLPELERVLTDAGLKLLGVYGENRSVVRDYENWTRGEPFRFSTDRFTDKSPVRMLLCQA